MAQKTRAEVDAAIAANTPDNSVQFVTPALMRSTLEDLMDSALWHDEGGAGPVESVNGYTGAVALTATDVGAIATGTAPDGQDTAEAIAGHVGADGVLVVEDDDIVSYPALVSGAPTTFTSASNALALDYDGIIEGITTMSESTTITFANIDNYARVVLQIVGHATTAYNLTWPAGVIINLPDETRTHSIVALSVTWAMIYRNGSGAYIVTTSNSHLAVA
jgi:hypothetical protein